MLSTKEISAFQNVLVEMGYCYMMKVFCPFFCFCRFGLGARLPTPGSDIDLGVDANAFEHRGEFSCIHAR